MAGPIVKLQMGNANESGARSLRTCNALAAFSLLACAAHAAAAAPKLPAQWTKLAGDFDALLEKDHVVGGSIALVQDGRIVDRRHYGFADLAVQAGRALGAVRADRVGAARGDDAVPADRLHAREPFELLQSRLDLPRAHPRMEILQDLLLLQAPLEMAPNRLIRATRGCLEV
jgi:hypothetical protein